MSDSSGNALWRIAEWFPDLPAAVESDLRAFHVELLKFNAKVNLISRATEREADEVHFADSLLAVRPLLAAHPGESLSDLGAGNGFPGLIMAILDRSRAIHLVESDVRKCEFLKHVAHVLKLDQVVVDAVRIETLSPVSMKLATARGFASLAKTCLLCNRLMPVGGQFYHLKTSTWGAEMVEFPAQILKSWAPDLSHEYTLPVSQVRRALVRTTKRA